MEYTVQLLDPVSSTQSQLRYRVPEGITFSSARLRLVDGMLAYSNELGFRQPYWFGQGGIHELIRKLSIVDSSSGTEIDRVSAESLLIAPLLMSTNDTSRQFSMSRVLSQGGAISCVAPSFSQLTLNESRGANPATSLQQTIDISALLDFCKQVPVMHQGIDIIVDLQMPTHLAWERYPVLAVNVFTEASGKRAMAQMDKPVKYFTKMADRVQLTHVPGSSIYDISTRLNSYYQQFIQNMYYMTFVPVNGRDPNTVAKALADEKFNLTINGKRLLPNSGISTSAMKLAHVDQFFGTTCTPTGSNAVLFEPLRLQNPNLFEGEDLLQLDGNASFGCLSLNKFVLNDISINYSATKPGDFNSALVVVAEVLRQYDPKTKRVSTVAPTA